MKFFKNLIFLFTLHVVLVACINVSPKLDFDEQSELIQVKKEITGKIKGLKVTVDTSELKESKSSGSESSTSGESGEKKKTVGVRTDVTFELTSGEDRNDTVSRNRTNSHDAEDNASIPVVPVFKGKPERGGGSNNRGLVRDPNSNDLWSVKPLNDPAAQKPVPAERYPPPNRRLDDDYPQYVIWTTERNHHRRPMINQPPPVSFHRDSYDNNNYHHKQSNFIPYQIHQPMQRPIHRPCDCKQYPGPYIRPLVSSSEVNRNQKVDDKLDRPFSRTTD